VTGPGRRGILDGVLLPRDFAIPEPSPIPGIVARLAALCAGSLAFDCLFPRER
jgi:hypothetical protein